MNKTFTQPLPMMHSTHTDNTRLTTSILSRWLTSVASIFFLVSWLWGGYAQAQVPTPNLLIQGTSASSNYNSDSRATAVDASGNTYMAGFFSGTVAFGSTTLTSAGSNEIFIAKYNPSGVLQWAKRAGGTGGDRAYGIAVLGSDVYITGSFNGTANFNTPSATGSNEITSAGGFDIFLAKYNSTGAFQWAKRAGGTGDDQAFGIAVSGSDVYITGNFASTANFNTPSATGSNEITSAGGNDIFLAKYSDAGVYQWAKRAGGTGTGNDQAYGIAVSGSDVYITGRFVGTANFNNPSSSSSNTITSAGGDNIFLAKYSNAGAYQWATRAGGTGNDQAYGIAVSGSNVYITGSFQSTANFNNPSATGSNEIVSVGNTNIFLAKYSDAGAYQWAKRAGGTGSDRAYGIAVSGSDVYITGNFASTANFNTPSATGSNEITSAGGNDIFLAKYSDAGDYQWATRAGGTGNDQANGIAVSGSDVYITGNFRGTANFNNPSATGSNELTAVATNGDAFLVRYGAAVATSTLTIGTPTNPTSCTTPNGSIAFTSTGIAAGSQTLSYRKDAIPTSTSVTVSANGAFTLTDLGEGTYTAFAIGSTTAQGTNPTLTSPIPTITLGTISSVSTSATSFDIPYTATTGSPDQFSISTYYNAIPSFVNIADRSFSGSPINVAIPDNTPAGDYNFRFSVRNNTTGCESSAGTVDLTVTAAVSCPSGNTLHVNASVVSGTGDGSTWANAYASLSDALAKAHSCTNIKTIKVAAGTYKPTKKPFNAGAEISTVDGRDIVFHIPDGVTIKGGYDAATDNRNISTNVTILSGDIDNNDEIGTDGKITSGNNTNAYHVVIAAGSVGVTIDGFFITGGNANDATFSSITVNGLYEIYRAFGGSIQIIDGTNTISDNTLYNNSAINVGGIFTLFSTSTISKNILFNNTGSNSIGGIYSRLGTNTISNNTLYNNSAGSGNGGGIGTQDGTNNTISNNTLYNNSARSGGGIYTYNGTNTISNNTVYNNTVTINGGGVSTEGGTNTLNNNIFWANKKGTDAAVASADYYANGTNGDTFKNNLLQLAIGNYTSTNSNALGTGASDNIFNTDPLFVDVASPIGADGKHRTADDGLALQSTSPAINKGITGAGIPTTDITDAARTGNPDMGAYEFIVSPPTITTFPATACVGSTIIITGTNFTGVTAVSIGGVAVSNFAFNSATQITAIIANGNTGTISVTTPNSVAVSSGSFTAKNSPTVPIISGNTEVCEGLGTTLTASSLLFSYPNPNTTVTYGWTGGLTGNSILVSPTTTRTYRVAATAEGCTSDSSAVFTLTVNPKPATPSITADNMTICKGGTAILTGSCSTANASFRWTTPPFNTNLTAALPSTNQRVITEPGTYKGLCESDKGCLSNEFSITITQATDCSGQNFLTITPERPAICPGGSILMTATGCAGTLTWTSGTSSQTGTSVTLSPAATATYFVQCSTGGSSTFTLVVASNTLAVSKNVTTDKERFKAVTTLTSDKKVGNATFTPGANVIYEAGNSITLLPGFTAEKWSIFKAEIKTCTN